MIDNQVGITNPSSSKYFGGQRSTPTFESNITKLLASFRTLRSNAQQCTSESATTTQSAISGQGDLQAPKGPGSSPLIIHIYHRSVNLDSPLHPSNPSGMAFLPFLTPDTEAGEVVISKSVSSAFVGTNLEEVIRNAGIRTLVIAGLVTDGCVNSTTRMAADLHVVDEVDGEGNVVKGGKGRLILVADTTATFEKGGFDAETVQGVSLASLKGEFAEIMGTEEVVTLLGL